METSNLSQVEISELLPTENVNPQEACPKEEDVNTGVTTIQIPSNSEVGESQSKRFCGCRISDRKVKFLRHTVEVVVVIIILCILARVAGLIGDKVLVPKSENNTMQPSP